MSKTSHKKPSIVVVVPCYNEEESLPHLLNIINGVRKKLSKNYNIDLLLVNDGSSDKTQTVIENLTTKYDFLFFREFAFNSGHQSALRAGLNAAVDYDATIMMDADLQHPPEMFGRMIAEWEKGYKIVQMIRNDEESDMGVIRHFMSTLYYKLINVVSDIKLEYGASDFRLVDKLVIGTVAKSHEQNLFLRGYFTWLKVPRVTIEYKPNKRVAGTSKYSLKKLLKLAFQGILQFSEKPLRIAVALGMIVAFASFVYGLLLTILHLTGRQEVSGWTSLIVIMLFCFGINFIVLGIIGIYIAHSIDIQKVRPEFIIATEKLRQL